MPQCLVIQAWEGYDSCPPTQLQLCNTQYTLYGVVSRQRYSQADKMYVLGPHFVSFLYTGNGECWLQDCVANSPPTTTSLGSELRAMRCSWPPKAPTNLQPHCIRYVFYTCNK
jgi:hypothetical protein